MVVEKKVGVRQEFVETLVEMIGEQMAWELVVTLEETLDLMEQMRASMVDMAFALVEDMALALALVVDIAFALALVVDMAFALALVVDMALALVVDMALALALAVEGKMKALVVDMALA